MILTDGTHLMTDSDNLDELHHFAQSIGLRREWFQNKPLHPHYDLTTRRMASKAEKAGAQLVSGHELVRRCSSLFRKRVRITGNHPHSGKAGEVVDLSQTPAGLMLSVQLDDGEQCGVFSSRNLTILGERE